MQAHILIFLIAACHLIWAMLSTVLSVLALRSWHQYEARMKTKGLLPMPVGGLQREGEPVVFYRLRQCLRQFTHPVNEAQFGAIRALFIDFTKVPCLHCQPPGSVSGCISSLRRTPMELHAQYPPPHHVSTVAPGP